MSQNKKTKRPIRFFAFSCFSLLLLLLASSYYLYEDHQTQLFGEIISRVETDEKVIAMTFDDGPSKNRTERILEILKQEDIKATFFLNGKAIKKNMKQAKLLAASDLSLIHI